VAGYEHEPFEIGKAEVRRTSESATHQDVAILVYGFLLREAWEAKARLEAEGRDGAAGQCAHAQAD
jgi:deoxyxylulose-5-phosphate synthase